jgi:hypothetical protein
MKSTTSTIGLFSLKCLDPRISDSLLLDKKKILIGSHASCDFKITDKSISSYHAFICLKGEGFMVKDLYSEGGIYVNGRRIEEAFVNPGDVLTIGTLSFEIELSEAEVHITNLDEAIGAAAFVSENVELPTRAGLIFIDGEYCDIKFNEDSFSPLIVRPEISFSRPYVELDESQESLEIAHHIQAKKLEIISYVNGLMMDVSYLNLKDGDYYLSPEKKNKFDVLFHTVARSKIFSITKGELHFVPNEGVTPSVSWEKINLQETLFLTQGSEQISLRFVDQSIGLSGLPLFYRDRAFYKQAGKVFASFFLPMLLLLFVTIPKPEEEREEVAIVYKLVAPKIAQKPTESQEKSEVKAEELTSKTENTGHKDSEQNPNKVEFAQASKSNKQVAKATAPAAAQAQPIKATPVKAYEFKTSVAVSGLVGDAPKMNTEGSSTKSAVTDTSFNAGTADNGQLVAGADIGVSKFNGSDKKGSGPASYGSRGLASKSGFDSSYLEPKTVVLGSMDPELLRKILREYIPQFRHCYQQELIGQSEKVKGIIDLNFTISAAGRVAKYNIKVKDAQFSQKGVGCMGQVLSLIDFPKPKGGGVVDVRQPLNFFAETEKI